LLAIIPFSLLGEIFNRQQIKDLFASRHSEVESKIAAELNYSENVVRRICSNEQVINYFDFGNSAGVKIELGKEFSKAGLEGFLAQDFQGDLFAQSLPAEISSLAKTLVPYKPDPGKQFSAELVWQEPSLYIVQRGLVGRLTNPSGVVTIIAKISDDIIASVEGRSDLIGCIYVGGTCFGREGAVQGIVTIDAERIPKNLKQKVPPWLDETTSGHTYRISAIKAAIPQRENDVFLLSILPNASVGALDLSRVGLYGFIVGLIIFLSLLPVTMIPISALLRDMKVLKKYLAASPSEREKFSGAGTIRSGEMREIFAATRAGFEADILAKNHLQAEKISSEKIVQKIREVALVEDSMFKIFMDHMLASLAAGSPAIEKMKSPEGIQPGLDELIAVAEDIRDDAVLFHLREIRSHASQVEDFLRTLRTSSRLVDVALVEEIRTTFEALAAEVNSYRDLRHAFTGRDLSDLVIAPISIMHMHWLISLTSRALGASALERTHPEVLAKLRQEFNGAVMRIGKVDIRTYIEGYNKLIVLRMERSGCKVRPIEFSGNHFFFGESRMQAINNMIVHCLRNALDHGMENGPIRVKNGKSPEGTIRLLSETVGDAVELTISDDGKGMNIRNSRWGSRS
jgi:signal transduction histidine kinase